MNKKNELMSFAPEENSIHDKDSKRQFWKLLIVDDEAAVHETTIRVLKGIQFEGKDIRFLHAYSSKEAEEIIRDEDEIAVILLDVIMEEENSGLKLVKYIRENISNKLVRIILRTGQPGKTPEKEVIIKYDINDYKSKTELTANKLFSTIISSLRSFRDLKIISNSKKGLEHIIRSSSDLFFSKSIKEFAFGALTQLLSFLNLDEDSLYINVTGLSLEVDPYKDKKFYIHAATGKYEKYIEKYADSIIPEEILALLKRAIKEESSFFDDQCYVAYFKSSIGNIHLLYIRSNNKIAPEDRKLITLFSENVGNAFENINSHFFKNQNQNEIIFLLSDILEQYSIDLANHAKRVSRFSELFAKKVGLSENETEVLKTAVALHDIGNVKTPKEILTKPGKLTEKEYEIVKNHAELGFSMLKEHSLEVLQISSIIALQHHENYDGNGYPNQLKGEEIDIKARIAHISDAFDVLLHQRPYKHAWDKQKVVEHMLKESGKQFDPKLVDILMRDIDEFMSLNEFLSK